MNIRIRDILEKGKAKTSSVEEQQEMFSLFDQTDKENIIKDKLLEDLNSETFDNEDEFPQEEAIFSKIWQQINRRNNKNRHLFNTFKIAVILVIGVFIGVLLDHFEATPAELVYYEARSPKGSVSQVILPDSSVIYLNAGSKIKYSMNGENGIREVFLNGEAWFNVEKNETTPFVVHTPYYDVNVTGTQFNIKAYDSDNYTATTLEEGNIILKSTDEFKLAEEIQMKPGEQAVLFKDSKKISVKEVNTRWYTSWKDNRIIFVNMNFKDVVVLLERKYGVDIEIKNKEILDLHVYWILKDETIIEFLEIIKKLLPVDYKIVGQKIEITNAN